MVSLRSLFLQKDLERLDFAVNLKKINLLNSLSWKENCETLRNSNVSFLDTFNKII